MPLARRTATGHAAIRGPCVRAGRSRYIPTATPSRARPGAESRIQGGNGLCQGHVPPKATPHTGLNHLPAAAQRVGVRARSRSHREIAISSGARGGWLDLVPRLHSIHIFVHIINRRHSIHTYAYYESAPFHSYIRVYMINRRRSRPPEVSARASRHIRGSRGTTMRM